MHLSLRVCTISDIDHGRALIILVFIPKANNNRMIGDYTPIFDKAELFVAESSLSELHSIVLHFGKMPHTLVLPRRNSGGLNTTGFCHEALLIWAGIDGMRDVLVTANMWLQVYDPVLGRPRTTLNVWAVCALVVLLSVGWRQVCQSHFV